MFQAKSSKHCNLHASYNETQSSIVTKFTVASVLPSGLKRATDYLLYIMFGICFLVNGVY